MNYWISVLLICLVWSSTAVAQYCPPAPIAGACDPKLQGNPLDTGTGGSLDTSRDFTFRTSLWSLDFNHRFVSNSDAWANWGSAFPNALNGVPAPFGKGPTGTGLRTWHSLYSLALVSPSTVAVRDMSGYQTEFEYCDAWGDGQNGCWAPPKSYAPSVRARLRMEKQSSGVKVPTLIQPDGLILNMHAQRVVGGIGGPQYFLSSVKHVDDYWNEDPLLTITYFGPNESVTSPPSFVTVACQAGDQGVPFIKEVSFLPASTQKLYFEYGLAGTGVGVQCVLKKVISHNANGIDLTLVQYGYVTNSGGFPELASRENAIPGAATESYDYSSGFYRYMGASGQGLITGKVLDSSFKIVSSTGGGVARQAVSNTASATTCSVMGSDTCCNQSSPIQTVLDLRGSAGDGSTSPAVVRSIYYSMAGAYQSTHDMVLYRKDVSLQSGPPGVMSPGTEEWVWRDVSGGANCSSALPGVLWAYKNKRDVYTVTPHQLTYPGNPSTAIEKTARLSGATDRAGGSSLESEAYEYSYGRNNDQRIFHVRKPSSLVTGSESITETQYTGNTRGSRVKSIIKEGYVKTLAGATVIRRIGTFYRTVRSCSSPATDLFDRVLRIEGPCEVSALSAQSCSGTSFPVTEFLFENGAATDSTSGRLLKVWRYPNFSTSSCGLPLVTEYASYSPAGLPTSVIEESGATRSFSYAGELLLSTTIGSAVTSYEYEGSRLTKTTYPLLNYERICYRTGADSACAGGVLKDKIQWRAKYDSAGTWSEKVEYQYGADDGSLQSEVYLLNDGTGVGVPRLEKKQQRDAQQRLTFAQAGSGALPSMQTKAAFDAADNRVAVSIPYALAPSFCQANSKLCRWMQYDRSDRLTQMDSFPTPTTSASQRTCFEYDRQGNLRRTVAGCSTTGSACANNVSNNLGTEVCNQGYIDYEIDDFGNTASVTVPWSSGGLGRGTTRYEYDSLGSVTKKQTAEMAMAGASVASTYDTLGRLLTVTALPANNLLYSLGYDADESVEAGCPALTFGDGRLTLREDSFGKTWYLYDQFGNITKEVRRRAGLLSLDCDTLGNQQKNPHTSYSYNLNGALVSIQYPHGRTVVYSYPTSGAADRPSSMSYTTWNGAAWTAPVLLIDNISWEPYGALRAYRFASTGQWVEYLKQGSLETAPTAGTCGALSAAGWGPTDGSGRLRGVFVSDGPFSLGNPNGNILKQVYTWNSDQLVYQHTCHKNSGAPQVESFTYDLLPRLTSKTDVGAAMDMATYAYDRRNNRTGTTLTGTASCDQVSDWLSSSWQVDMPSSTQWGPTYGTVCNATKPASGKYNYSYDRDGRRTTIWDDNLLYQVVSSYAIGDFYGPAIDGVFKSASITSGGMFVGSYSYFYDAFARRRAKTTPWSSTDEYFYDTGHQILSDRGVDVVGAGAISFPEDDYVWLGGRPIAFVRSKFAPSTWTRTADGVANFCNRDSVSGLCGTFHLVTDYLGKPIAVYDRGNTAGTATYEGFGFANRGELRYGSSHYAASSSVVATITPPIPSGGTSGCVTPPSGIVSWWPADGNTSDIVGTNAGTIAGGVTFVPGMVGSAFRFNGIDGIVSATTVGMPIGSSDRTIELWVRVDSVSSDEGMFAGYGSFGSSNSTYHLGSLANGGQTFFSQWGQGLVGSSIPLATWTHVAVTTQSGTSRLFLNGVQATSGALTINTPSGSMFNMGKIAGSNGNTRRLSGALDEVTVYNRALTASEISALAASPLGKCQGSSGFDGYLRVLMSRSSFSASSSVMLGGVTQTGLQGNRAHAWSDWQYASTPSWAVQWNGAAGDYGFDMEAYEIRAKQHRTWWAWTPLRYPGHYYDQETELNENWNRYYDPSTGRYLSPEPLLQDPHAVLFNAKKGRSMPTYAYAFNNPLAYTDEDGLMGRRHCDRLSVRAEVGGGNPFQPDKVCNCRFSFSPQSGGKTCYIDSITQVQTEDPQFAPECEPFRKPDTWGNQCQAYCAQQANKLWGEISAGSVTSFSTEKCDYFQYKYVQTHEENCVGG